MSHQESVPPDQQKDDLATRIPEPEVVPKAKRRQFTAQYKMSILEEADRCRERGQICEKHGVTFDAHNLWDLDDEDVDELPTYMSSLIREWRTGQRPGSVYSDVFVNGERIPIDDWPRSFEVIEVKAVAMPKGGGE
jgi:hypothetical protein